MISYRIIQDLTDEIVVDIGALYKASEAVALLDLLWSFAHASIRACSIIPLILLDTHSPSVRNYSKLSCGRSEHDNHTANVLARPELTGTLAIKGGRHPVLECVQSAGATVPNDVFCCEASSFQIVQGPKYAADFLVSMSMI